MKYVAESETATKLSTTKISLKNQTLFFLNFTGEGVELLVSICIVVGHCFYYFMCMYYIVYILIICLFK